MAYLASYVPEPNATRRSVKTSWAGLNRKHSQDTGELSSGKNISVRELPYLKSAEMPVEMWDSITQGQYADAPFGENIVSIHDIGDGSFVAFCTTNDSSTCSMYIFDETGKGRFITDTIYVPENTKPSVAVFNAYTSENNDIVTSTFERKILIFPAGTSYDLKTGAIGDINYNKKDENGNTNAWAAPKLKHITVLNGRVFGVLDGKIFASRWNNYADFFPPRSNEVADDVSDFPWVSTTQSDIDASGEFTGITVYGGQVIGFKRNFMHMIYNNKNPFRIVDIAKVGAISQEAICEVNQVLYFVAEDGVYAFSGGYPRRISDKLDIPVGEWEGSKLGGDDRTLYCYVPSQEVIYTYDAVNGAWGTISADADMFAMVGGNCLFSIGTKIYRMNGEQSQGFAFDTDASFGGSLTEKKIKRIRLQVSHKNHNDGDHITISVKKANGVIAASKTLTPKRDCDTVTSMLTRMTCDFGQKICVEGKGDWVVKYLQLDYETGGEKYV